MAKRKMLCPFSREICRECPAYRGRHYYLCYQTRYRGCLENPGEKAELKSWTGKKDLFDLPSLPTGSPTWLVLNEFAERKEK